MSTDDGKRLAQLHDAMQDRIRELEEALTALADRAANELADPEDVPELRHARYVLAKGIAR